MVARRAGSLGHGCRSQDFGVVREDGAGGDHVPVAVVRQHVHMVVPAGFCVPTRNNVSSVPPTAATQRAASVSNTAELIAECAWRPDREGEEIRRELHAHS